MSLKLGILGAGQLAYYLAQEAKDLGFHVEIAGHSEKDPALLLADEKTILGADTSGDVRRRFSENVDLLLFENEWMADFPIPKDPPSIHPAPDVMKILSDKLEQKRLFSKNSLKTSPFLAFDPSENPRNILGKVKEQFKDGFVLKFAQGGYDGKGVLFIGKDKFEDVKLNEEALRFIEAAFHQDHPIYAEKAVCFSREVALVSVRSTQGEMAFYPLVETIQERGTCRIVVGPLENSETQEEAQKLAKAFAESLGYVGTFAIEFFDSEEGLLINEVAPRVHNSGHFSLDAAKTSQFKNHILAASGQALGSADATSDFAMVNILGPDNFKGPINPPEPLPKGCTMHWYKKADSKPRRKLGHINIEAESKSAVQELIDQCLKIIDNWENSYSNKGL